MPWNGLEASALLTPIGEKRLVYSTREAFPPSVSSTRKVDAADHDCLGVMVQGSHHQPHHLLMAMDKFAH
jgi:hypothetical protein